MPVQAQQLPAAATPEPATVLAADASAAAATIEVTGRHYDNAVGSSDAASQGTIRAELIKSRPALRPGEVLEFVPGMVVTQHSGDGKANQYFLRGFNLDHGTDFATTVDGMPVNMVTHAHGQGFADLNFLIPELVQRIEYRKGPYFARGGDLASAGSADISYRNTLDLPSGQLTLGGHGYRRGLFSGSGTLSPGGIQALGAVELMANDGPWTVREGLQRRNGIFGLSGGTAAEGWQAHLMAYRADWTATDQVPQRLVDAGSYLGRPFGRYDSLNPTDGGSTGRSSLSGEWHRNDDGGGSTRVSGYAMRYRIALWNDYTYGLVDDGRASPRPPAEGDQFSQQEHRSVYGLQGSHSFGHTLAGLPARSEVGLQLRHDDIRVDLLDTVARQAVRAVRDDQVGETLLGLYGQSALELTPWLRSLAGLRVDHIANRVDSLLLAANSGRAQGTQWSPKFTLVAGPFARTEWFINAGRGLHSNDARGTTARADPLNPAAAIARVPALVASQGAELGLRTEAIPGLQTSLALWRLNFDSELLYVGDAGTTEASAASRRHGVEFNNHWSPRPWLLLDADLAWSHSRFVNGDRIPNAVDKVASVGATLRNLGRWSGSLQWRYLGSGALVEDNSVRSLSSLTTNLRLGYLLTAAGPGSELTLDVFNLFNRQVSDIQYFYTSQLPGEAAPVADRHVHPGEPRALRVSLKLGF
jgi:hypothetical protein